MSQSRAATASQHSATATRGPFQTLREALQLFWSVADSFAKQRLVLALAFVACGALLAAITPIALKLVIDAFALGAEGAGSVAHAAPLAFLGLYVVGQYLTRSFSEVRMFLFGRAEQRVRRRIGRRLFAHLVRLPLRFHLERKTGAIGETVEQGLYGYQLLLTHFIYTILPVAIEFVAVALVLIHFDHQVYIGILAVASVAYVVVFQHGAKAISEPSTNITKSHIEAHAVLTDSLINHETVKYFDAKPVVCNRYDSALGRTESAWHRFYSRRAVNGLLVAAVFATSLGVSLFYAANDVTRGAMTIGDFVLVNAYVVRLVQPLEMLGFAVRDVAQGLAFLQTMLDLFQEKTENDDHQAHSDPSVSRGELVFDNVSFSYREERIVLRNISFSVPAGKTVAIVGVSGSGKSSLIRLLFRLYEPSSGRILLDGTSTTEMSLSTLRQAIAVVPQDTVLFHDTIANNIGFGRDGSSMREIEEAARIANLHELIMSMPERYETVVGERGLKLSGGERQRVAIARAALKQPRIFVFDEATSSLDTKTERDILRNLLDVSAHSTTLVIAHRLSTIVHAHQILVLENGVIVERGTHDELLKRNAGYATLWQAQQSALSIIGVAANAPVV